MKYVSVITDYNYLLWQQELQIFNFANIDLLDNLAVVILLEPGIKPSSNALRISKTCECHFYVNNQPDRSYTPSNKPYGVMKLLESFPDYGRHLFLLDSDVMLRQPIDFLSMSGDYSWYMSDTRSYIGYNYLSYNLTDDEISSAIKITGLDLDTLKQRDAIAAGGAQYYFKDIAPDFCGKVARDSVNIYHHLNHFRRPDGNPKVQVWTAEMWSWLWNSYLMRDVGLSSEMDFTWPGDPVYRFQQTKILHMAGVMPKDERDKGLFRKGKYTNLAPWLDPRLEVGLRQDNAAWQYVELIKSYRDKLQS